MSENFAAQSNRKIKNRKTEMKELTEEEFYEKVYDIKTKEVKATKNTVVDFYSSTCGPCRMFGKLFEQFSETFADWDFYKVCIDDADDIMIEYKLRTMPTVLRIKGGVQELFAGVHKAEELQEILTGEIEN